MFKVQAVGLANRGSTAGSGNNVPCPWHRPDWPCVHSVETEQPGRAADHWPLSRAKFKNVWSFIYLFIYLFICSRSRVSRVETYPAVRTAINYTAGGTKLAWFETLYLVYVWRFWENHVFSLIKIVIVTTEILNVHRRIKVKALLHLQCPLHLHRSVMN